MKNQFEYIGQIFNVKELKTNSGYGYKFSIPITTTNADKELKEWMNGIIFTKEAVTLTERGEAHFIAKLEVSPAYGEHPQRLGFIGFTITPLFQKAFNKAKSNQPKPHKEKQDSEASDYVPF